MPSFSIIIPCYNAAATLQGALDSLRRQTCGDWEAILVDDGSADDTFDRIADAAQMDLRMRFLHQRNAGPSAARNRGLQLAQGRYIAFLDADDRWHPRKLARHLDLFQRRPEVDVSFARVAFVDPRHNAHQYVSDVPTSPLGVLDLLAENRVCTMSNLVARSTVLESVGGFDETMVHGEDRHWLVRAAAHGHRIQGIPETCVDYHVSVSGLSANLEAMHGGWRRSVETARDLGCRFSDDELARAEAVYLRYLARRALRVGTAGTIAARYAMRGASLSPAAFFGEPRRGVPTFVGSLAAMGMPAPIRRAVFSD